VPLTAGRQGISLAGSSGTGGPVCWSPFRGFPPELQAVENNLTIDMGRESFAGETSKGRVDRGLRS